MADAHAWLLSLGGNYQIALSDREMVEYLVDVNTLSVPLTPNYCAAVMPWRERLVPVIDINPLIAKPYLDSMRHLCVVAYQEAPRTPLRHVAIVINGPPLRVPVDDDQACAVPPEYKGELAPLALAALELEGRAVPIFDIAYLCSTDLRDARNGSVKRRAIIPEMEDLQLQGM